MPDEPDTSLPAGLQTVELNEADAGRCLALSIEAGWNQSLQDWQLMLDYGTGFGIESADTLVGTAVIVPYPPEIAWISMVLVAKEWRRKGLGTELMRRCISSCNSLNLVPFLDATEDGIPVYLSLGFTGSKSISRFTRQDSRPGSAGIENRRRSRVGITADWQEINRTDLKTFRANRASILESLVGRTSGVTLLVSDSGHGAGAVTGRPGIRFYHIGPLLASSDTHAIELVETILNKTSGPFTIDVPDVHYGFQESLRILGFERQRSFRRMHLGDVKGVADPDGYYAIAGPEYG
ncbi:MAG: GNAT family N-acetyltransferase [Rhodothermales bacterium]|nr:GNAT family N-acetyltransferase [Rhodothermales bacterium]